MHGDLQCKRGGKGFSKGKDKRDEKNPKNYGLTSDAPLLPVVVATLIFRVDGTISVRPFKLIVKV